MAKYITSERIEERIWLRVNKTSTCWLWTGYLNKGGYAQFSISADNVYLVHRWMYENHKKTIPLLANGKESPLDHLCRVRHCVNPDHLEVVTPKENVLRGLSLQSPNAKKTHCVNNHLFDEVNTYRYDNNKRRGCKRCRKEANKRFRLKKSTQTVGGGSN